MREKIQKEAIDVVVENNFNCVICLEMGTGKSKIGIDAIKIGKFKNVLITSPRTNLKDSWKKELNKWGFANTGDLNLFCENNKTPIYINIENIQTCYKWSKDRISEFDFIICDEVHLIATPEYSILVKNATDVSIPVLGLTGTPDKEDEFKSEFYSKILPIKYEYYDSAKDGLINKRRYYVYKYNLSDDFKVDVSTKNRSWRQGELSRYLDIQRVFEESKERICAFYFNQVKLRANILTAGVAPDSYKRFFKKITSKDLEYFRKIYWNMMKSKKFPYNLYKSMRFIADDDYAKFGMKANYYATKAPEEIRSDFYKYIWARNERKKFLLNLESSLHIARAFKHRILESKENKVLIFSELTDQCKKISTHSVHSKNKESENKEKLVLFDSGDIRELSSCNTLTLGLNLVRANYAIMESYNSSETSVAQKMGRLNRLESNEVANVIIIVPANTQAEEWFNEYSKKMKITNPIYLSSIKDLEV